MALHRHILNQKFTITRHRNLLRVSENEKKTTEQNIFFQKKKKGTIYRYILAEYFVLNI